MPEAAAGGMTAEMIADRKRVEDAVTTVARFLNFEAIGEGKRSPTFEAMRIVLNDYTRLVARATTAERERDEARGAALELAAKEAEAYSLGPSTRVAADDIAARIRALK